MWFLTLWLTPLLTFWARAQEKNPQLFVSICVATKFTGQWLLSGSLTLSGQQPSPQNMAAWVAAILSPQWQLIHQVESQTLDTTMHMIYTHLRKSRAKSQGYNLWVKYLAALTKGDEDKSGQRWCCAPSLLKQQNLEQLQGFTKLQQLPQPQGTLESHRIRKVWRIAAKLTLSLTHPLPSEGVAKNSVSQGPAHARLSVLVWKNFSWNLREFRSMY